MELLQGDWSPPSALLILIDLVFIALLTLVLSRRHSYQFFTAFCTRHMDGLVVCAMDWHSSSSGVRTLVPPPVTGPLAAPQPPPPSASRPTIGTAGGWVACLVFIFYFSIFNTSKTKRHSSGTPVAVRPAAGRRGTHLLLIFLFRGSNWRLQSGRRLHCRCTRRPKPNLTAGNFYGSKRQARHASIV